MGFYGNIKNTSRTQFSFDKVFSNRVEMDNSVNIDGIYAGRFVLIEYDQEVHPDLFRTGYLKDGVVFASIPTATGGMPVPYTLVTKDTENDSVGAAQIGELIHIPAEFNFDQEFYGNLPGSIFVTIGDETLKKENYPSYVLNPETGELETYTRKDPDTGETYMVSIPELYYVETNAFNVQWSGTNSVESSVNPANYIKNFNIDRQMYGVARGYDSTVWQKVYEGAGAKYVMVAELNSVVPTFDLAADAPTQIPVLPHFDADSTNIYYKLHWQPQWGIRLKASDPLLRTPVLRTDGSADTSEIPIQIREDQKEYPSDLNVTWGSQIYDEKTGVYKPLTFVVDDGNGNPAWMNPIDVRGDQDQVSAAVYFNKAGFNPAKITYSHDEEYGGWLVDDEGKEAPYLVKDEITLAPTGYSGHRYNKHNYSREISPAIDTQELAIMLPSIGDSIAQIWDIVYGGRELFGPEAKDRKTDIKWYNAKAVDNKDGLRMIHRLGPGRYTYDTKAASTFAGVINSAQDLLGMIITDQKPENAAGANGDYIYYDNEVYKYQFKHKTWEYTEKTFPNNRIPDDYSEFDTSSLQQWDKSHFYVDTATNSGYEFILEDTFYPDRKYISKGKVEISMNPIHLGGEYKPDGSYYKLLEGRYESNNAVYSYFVPSKTAYDPLEKYYTIEKADEQVGEGEYIYIPNNYYYINYSVVEISDSIYEPGVYYIQFDTALVGGEQTPLYRVAIEDTLTEALEDSVNGKFYKRQYILDTGLVRTEGRKYYTVLPDTDQSSNAYYKKNITAEKMSGLTYETYEPNKYYYIVNEKPASGNWESINGVFYVQDTREYTDANDFAAAGHDFYSLKIDYELVLGADIIEITDENAIEVLRMRDLSEFKSDMSGGFGRDIFYTFVDSEKVKRYIEVNYNNFSKAYNAVTQKYEFIVLNFEQIGEAYHKNSFYYKIEDDQSPKYGSYLIDNSDNITKGRQYYEFVPRSDIDYSGEFLTGYFAPGKYYVEYPEGSGKYILVEDPTFDPNATYLDPALKLYVLEDSEGIYSKGAEWPMEIKQIPEGVKLATREEIYEFKDLPEFGDKMLTLYGLLLKLYKHIDETDKLTRDDSTARGSINLFNDLMHRFSDLVPGQFTLVDDYGRMHSAKLSTAQALTFKTEGPAVAGKASRENALVTINIDSNFKQPTLEIIHSEANTVANTTDTYNVNGNGDTINLITPIYDNAGHIVGKNTRTVTLPYGFKKVIPANNSVTGDLTANTAEIVADNTQDTLTISSQNKWIKLAAENNTLKIAHTLVSTSFNGEKSNSQDATPKFGATFNIPVVTVDNAGHLTSIRTETVKIPGLVYTDDTGANNDVVLNIAYNYDESADVGTFTETRGKVDELLIQDYSLTGVTAAKLANTDKIHQAFAKLQAQINGMDLTKVGGGDGEYISEISENDGVVTASKKVLPTVEDVAQEGYYVSAVSQSLGKIALSRVALPTVEDNAVDGEFVSSVSQSLGKITTKRIAIAPSITLTDGTATDAPKFTITINTKTSSEKTLNKATTGVYGVTKLTSTYSSTSSDLAMNGVAVNAAIATLKHEGASDIDAAKTIKSWKEENGVVTIEIQDIKIKNENIADDAAIAMTKIDGLANALTENSNTLLGDENSEATSMTISGLSKRIDSVVGTEEDTAEATTIQGLLKRIEELEARIEELHKPIEEETPVEPESGEEEAPTE